MYMFVSNKRNGGLYIDLLMAYSHEDTVASAGEDASVRLS